MGNYAWGKRSKEKRGELDSVLSMVFDQALARSPFDLAITDAHRGEALQTEAFISGASKLNWPDSKHNSMPAKAGHLDPFPIDYKDIYRYYMLAGVVWAAADELALADRLRWGGDWDQDFDLDEETFRDLAHWEIIDA